MLSYLFNTFLYEPLYNGLLFLVAILPGADLGIAVIILTLLVKFALLPLAHKTAKTQVKMKELDPHIKAIKEKHKSNKQEQAKQMMDLYGKHGVSPFSGIIAIFIQLPIIIALYWVFFKGLKVDPALLAAIDHLAGNLPSSLLNHDILYSFVHLPESIKVEFLGLVDLTGKSIVLALIAGISQYVQINLSMPKKAGEGFLPKSTGSLKDDLAQNMGFQMRYILPVFVGIFAYSISAAVALYWAVSNIFAIVHEVIVRKKNVKSGEKEGNTESAAIAKNG
ncbi:MAG: YidC/Oxa1 family membrane protein insertase [Patescibacteria group bacterium]